MCKVKVQGGSQMEECVDYQEQDHKTGLLSYRQNLKAPLQRGSHPQCTVRNPLRTLPMGAAKSLRPISSLARLACEGLRQPSMDCRRKPLQYGWRLGPTR